MKVIKAAKRDYLDSEIMEPLAKGDCRPFYSYLSSIRKNQGKAQIALNIDGEHVSDPLRVANELNSIP